MRWRNLFKPNCYGYLTFHSGIFRGRPLYQLVKYRLPFRMLCVMSIIKHFFLLINCKFSPNQLFTLLSIARPKYSPERVGYGQTARPRPITVLKLSQYRRGYKALTWSKRSRSHARARLTSRVACVRCSADDHSSLTLSSHCTRRTTTTLKEKNG